MKLQLLLPGWLRAPRRSELSIGVAVVVGGDGVVDNLFDVASGGLCHGVPRRAVLVLLY